MPPKLRLGRIRYINVLPIYHAFDLGRVENGFDLVLGTPAELNRALAAGRVDVSAISSAEYGRNFREYLLLPQLSISTEGDVGSVLFFSRVPFHRLTGREVRLSEASATSAALVKILLYELFGARPFYRPGQVSGEIPEGAYGLLAIGDEALRLRYTGRYPYFLDLGRAWRDLTALPFVFGVWAVRREVFAHQPEAVRTLHQALLAAKRWGVNSLQDISRLAVSQMDWDFEDMVRYFRQLNYDLKERQLEGLQAFYQYLHRYGTLSELPELDFI
jgi:chorismate dehydratase